jgi:hypothetical protein
VLRAGKANPPTPDGVGERNRLENVALIYFEKRLYGEQKGQIIGTR